MLLVTPKISLSWLKTLSVHSQLMNLSSGKGLAKLFGVEMRNMKRASDR